MSKKIKYQITRTCFMTVTVYNEDEEQLVEELNRDFYRTQKQDKVYHNKTVSLDKLKDLYDYDMPDSCNTPDEEYEDNELKEAIHKALVSLTAKQRKIVEEHVFEDKSFAQIAREMNQDDSTIRKCYYVAINKLKILLKDFN